MPVYMMTLLLMHCHQEHNSNTRNRLAERKNIVEEDELDARAALKKNSLNLSSPVQEQYTDLPYPPFTVTDLIREQSYYSFPGSRRRPLFYQHSNSLNVINHHLFQVQLFLS